MKILEEKDWVGFNGDSDHKETKAILKLWFIYIPLAFGEFVFSNIIGYLKNKDFAFEKQLT